MTKEELIKVFSAYLPYDLEVCTSYGSPKLNNPKMMCGADIDRIKRNKTAIFVMKPILLPLEYLTKEIEHEGKQVIPIVEILKKTSLLDLSECKFEVWEDEEKHNTVVYVNAENKNGRVIDSMFYDNDLFWHMDNDGSFDPTNPQREPQEMLLKFHFNVFGLKEGEYINKSTLTNKQ